MSIEGISEENFEKAQGSSKLSRKSIEEIDGEIELENARKVEAALFLAGRYMTIQELMTLTDINPILLKKILADLSDKYDGMGLSIVKQENMWKMDVSEDFVWMVNRLATGSSEFTKAEQETLAMIAYKQPMKQSVLIKIRGNKAYDHVKAFVDRGLINKKRAGHTSELTLTEKFHDYFHVTNPSSQKDWIRDHLRESETGGKEDSRGTTKDNGLGEV